MATSNFNFTLLTGSDTAGYNSINTLITSIDNQIYAKVAVPGMIIIWDSDEGTAPSGWTNLGSTVAGLYTLTAPYVYIRKSDT